MQSIATPPSSLVIPPAPTDAAPPAQPTPPSRPLLREGSADAVGAVRSGPGRLTALRFAIEQAVLGRGLSADARVRAWNRRHWLRTRVGFHGPLGAARAVIKTPARVLREARQAVAAHGAACRAAHGVPEWRQVLDLFRLSLFYGIDADSYYCFWLFRPERRRRARLYVKKQHAAVLYRVVAAREALDDYDILEEKGRFAAWCAEHGFPHVPVLAEFRDGRMVAPESGAMQLPPCALFSKPSCEYGGVGVRMWRWQGDGTWLGEDGAAYDADALLASIAEQSRGGGAVLQPCVTNAEVIRPIAPRALGTLRVMTARPPGGTPEVLLACFRTGSGGSSSDNYSSGGIAMSVDLATGRLRSGVRGHPDLVSVAIEAHPDTGVPFAGFQVPQWEEAKALALAAHARLRSMPFVGWDVAFTPDGLILLEGNFNPGVRIVQAGWGTPLGETPYLEYLDAHLRRSFARAR